MDIRRISKRGRGGPFPVATKEEKPHVEILDAPTGENLPAVIQRPAMITPITTNRPGTVTIGKVPGKVVEVELSLTVKMTIRELYEQIGIPEEILKKCKIQRNCQAVRLSDLAQPGDTIVATKKIKGNKEN